MNEHVKELIIKNEMKAKMILPELDLSINKFVNYINKASKDYILYEFITRSDSSVQQKEKKKKMSAVGLTHSSDLIKGHKDSMDLEVVPMEEFFTVGKDYSIIDISFYSNSFHFEKGMYIVDEDTIVLKAGLNDKVSNTSKYPNKWVERSDLLEYSFMEEKEELNYKNKDYKHKENIMIYNSILGSKTIKIYLFVRYEKNAPYEYMGIYKPIKLSNENKSFILGRFLDVNEQVETSSEIGKDEFLIEISKSISDAAKTIINEMSVEKDGPLLSIEQTVSEGPVYIEKITEKQGKINYIEKQLDNSYIGLKGEEMVVIFEKNRLIEAGLDEYSYKVTHVALDNDFLGYDILSYDFDESGNVYEIYIEVKTTKLNFNTPFYVTSNELEKSKLLGEKYRLYRVYEINNGAPKVVIYPGSLDKFSLVPYTYIVKP